jgi:hypothetical protein
MSISLKDGAKGFFFGLALFIVLAPRCSAQPTTTALNVVPPYEGNSLLGSNFGYYPYIDEHLADLAAGNIIDGVSGVGAQSIRPALPEVFLEEWGYGIRLAAFQHYLTLDLVDNVAFIGYPSAEHRDPAFYCNGQQSEMFKDMYLPIWDTGQNGTPVNDQNHAALYVYKMVQLYGPYIRFWEVWNEPDLDYSGNAWKWPGDPGNWWDNNPDPCEYAIKAPISHYNRLLRIVYEVVKTLEPNDYICTGGIGYPSFLDAVIRQTDNPVDGSVTPEYPLSGGAYFDCLSFHTYPHIDGSMKSWNNTNMAFDLYRYSDAAADGVDKKLDEFEAVLFGRGFDGLQYPRKQVIITETNIPRKQIGDYVGSDAAQRNFLIKTCIRALDRNILQVHPYALAENEPFDQAQFEFSTMGFYDYLEGGDRASEHILQSGIAWRTMSNLLKEYTFDRALTEQLLLADPIKGAAFRPISGQGQNIYVLWAATSVDLSENASATFNFPNVLGVQAVSKYLWDYSETGLSIQVQLDDIQLTGDPQFFMADTTIPTGPEQDSDWLVFPNSFNDRVFVRKYLDGPTRIKLQLTDLDGRVLYNYAPPEQLPAGLYQWEIQPGDIPQRTYFLSMEAGDSRELQQILKY